MTPPAGMHRIVISEYMDDAAVALLRRRHDVAFDPRLVEDRPRLLAAMAEASAIIVRNVTRIDDELLAAAPRLKAVGRLGVGLDNIDVEICRARGIAVVPATGANAQAVAEYAVTTALMLLRGAYGATAAMTAGQWPRPPAATGREAAGKAFGIVGFGSIGQTTARLARALGFEVIAYARRPDSEAFRTLAVGCVGLDELLSVADVVSLHLPLTTQTRGLFDADRLRRCKPGAILINTARGGIVDEAALAEALREGRLAGAAFDVFADEPLPAGSPLADAPNLVLTPHIAGVTVESLQRVGRMVAEGVDRALRAVPA